MSVPERIDLAPGLSISGIVTGLWEVADKERRGLLKSRGGLGAMAAYTAEGFDTFDMSAEGITG